MQPSETTIAELERRYAGHPAAAASLWDRFMLSTDEANRFRGHTAYVWQDRHDHVAYVRSFRDLASRHPDLARRAGEDGAFGARCELVDGRHVSRDLLDSIAEIGFLAEALGSLDGQDILDIGAGYGRLGHRFDELASPSTCVRCVDAIPQSTILCADYLRFRRAARAETVALDRVEACLSQRPPTGAVSVHSFPEMPLQAVIWWLRLLSDAGAQWLLLVPNEIDDLRSTEVDGRRLPILPALNAVGFTLAHERLKYRSSRSSADDQVVFQDQLLFFVR